MALYGQPFLIAELGCFQADTIPFAQPIRNRVAQNKYGFLREVP